LLVVVISGCVPSYSIKPIYDENTKIVTIDTLKLNNANETLNRTPASTQYLGNLIRKVETYYFIDNKQCTSLSYFGISTGGNVFLISNFEEMVRQKYNNKKQLNCEVEVISNLKFYECPSAWLVGYSTPNESGYSNVESLQVDNVCFKTLRTYFREKAKIDKIKIKAYSL
jgi:hypothetical protein